MKRVFLVFLIGLCLSAGVAYSGSIWTHKIRDIKVYVLTCIPTDYLGAKRYMVKWNWQEVDIDEADFIFALFRSDHTSPLKKSYNNFEDIFEKETAKKISLDGYYYHVYLYKLSKDSPRIEEYYHGYMHASKFIAHNHYG